MRFSSVIFLAVVIASASSISATPIDSATPIEAGTEVCNTWCYRNSQCTTCPKQFCAFPWCGLLDGVKPAASIATRRSTACLSTAASSVHHLSKIYRTNTLQQNKPIELIHDTRIPETEAIKIPHKRESLKVPVSGGTEGTWNRHHTSSRLQPAERQAYSSNIEVHSLDFRHSTTTYDPLA
ncbi:uncharacterized protein HD556DRAFT_388444 [Suillus plorans]|uniref:Uncharacterized protein n=1 Tax=Suillus plorans TaxID=116603 RepID=A0A9P7DI70_9AGAM|nr:uncharacterized protein HD556DRAFT_388444 [Suillus plorans]KAG1795468.1 hypothetical protein HD556DRAFT_388444 [Suillus plorans]